MATEIGCKSDCYFANNDERKCKLKDIQLIQEDGFAPRLVCSQYVPTQVSQQRTIMADINKAMNLGLESAINGKVK